MSGDELTDNEPTVRYWRTVKSGNVKPIPVNAPKLTAALMDRGLHVEVVVMTPAELAAHTTAARADAWDEGRRAEQDYARRQEDADAAGQYVQIDYPRNPYRTPDPNGDNT